jgi:hypothetical protein
MNEASRNREGPSPPSSSAAMWSAHRLRSMPALGGHPPIAGHDQRDRWVRLRSLAQREGCARSDRS